MISIAEKIVQIYSKRITQIVDTNPSSEDCLNEFNIIKEELDSILQTPKPTEIKVLDKQVSDNSEIKIKSKQFWIEFSIGKNALKGRMVSHTFLWKGTTWVVFKEFDKMYTSDGRKTNCESLFRFLEWIEDKQCVQPNIPIDITKFFKKNSL